MTIATSKKRKRLNELSDYQLLALIKSQEKKLKEKHHDVTALAIVKNNLLRLKKEVERRKIIQN